MKSFNRRNFIKAGGVGLTGILANSIDANASKSKKIKNTPDELTILFQGDSITDAGRDRARYYPNETAGMGSGYVFQIVSHLLGTLPDKQWKYYNRGISGNKVFQLADRWDDDCLQLKPDILSILIGVNDFWHTLNNYDGTVEVYETDFRKLMDRTFAALPNVKMIIGEPFAVQGGRAISEKWFPEFPKYQEVAKKISLDYRCVFIPYQEIFNKALDKAQASYWSPDGVHPSMAGAYLMKEAWLIALSEIY